MVEKEVVMVEDGGGEGGGEMAAVVGGTRWRGEEEAAKAVKNLAQFSPTYRSTR